MHGSHISNDIVPRNIDCFKQYSIDNFTGFHELVFLVGLKCRQPTDIKEHKTFTNVRLAIKLCYI